MAVEPSKASGSLITPPLNLPSAVTIPVGPELQLAIGQAVLQQQAQLTAHAQRLGDELRSAAMQRGLLRTEIAALEVTNKALLEDSKRLQCLEKSTLPELQQRITALEEQEYKLLTVKDQTVPDLKKQNEALEGALQALDESSNAEILELKDRNSVLEAQVESFQEGLKRDLAFVRNENNDLLEKLHRQSAEYKAETRKNRKAAIDVLEHDLRSSKCAYENATVSLHAEIEHLKQTAATQLTTIDELNTQMQSFEETQKERHTKYASQDVQMTALTQHLLSLQGESRRLHEQLAAAEACVQRLKEEQLKREHAEGARSTEELEQLRAALATQTQELGRIKQDKAAVDGQLPSTMTATAVELQKLRAQVRDLKAMNEELEMKNNQLVYDKFEADEYHRSLERYRHQISDLQRANRKLQAQAQKSGYEDNKPANDGDMKLALKELGLLKSKNMSRALPQAPKSPTPLR